MHVFCSGVGISAQSTILFLVTYGRVNYWFTWRLKWLIDKLFSYLWDRVSSILTCAGKYCLAYWLRQLTRDTKSDVSCSQTMLTRRNKNLRMTFGVSRNITFKEIIDKTLMPTTNNRWENNHRSSMQTEKSQPSGQWIMPQTLLTSFPA